MEMCKTHAVKICVVFICILLLSATWVNGQQATQVKTLKLKKLATKNFTGAMAMASLIPTDKKYLTAFIPDLDPQTYGTTLRTMLIKSRGKVKTSGKEVYPGLFGDEGFALATVWIGDLKKGYGLLYILRMVDNQGQDLALEVASFDSDGKITSDFSTLLQVKGKDKRHNTLTLGAAQNGSNVSLALGFNQYALNGGSDIGAAYYLETDLEGNLTMNAREITLPNKGKMRSPHLAAPAWNGSNWLVPMRVTKFEPSGGWGTVRSGATVMVGYIKGSKGKIKPATIFDLNSKPAIVFDFAILPAENADLAQAGAVPMSIIYQVETTYNSGVIGYNKYDYYLQGLSKKGKKQGGRKHLNMPEIILTQKAQTGVSYYYNEGISAPCYYMNGLSVLALTRNMEKSSGNNDNYEQSVNVITIDPKTGKVGVLARKTGIVKGVYANPAIAVLNGKISLLAPMRDKAAQSWTASALFWYAFL
jgi:hypothetical protein